MKLNKKKGICTGCHFKLTCTLAEPLTMVWNCSEYEPEHTFEGSFDAPTPTSSPTFTKGICSSCSAVSSCSLTVAPNAVFQCEQYQ